MNTLNETKTLRRPFKALRALALAAMLTLALAVTANAASNGALFENLRVIWQDGSHIIMEDDSGSRVEVTGVYANAELRDGVLVLTVDGAEFDITDEIVENGAYSATVQCADGTEAQVHVTGTLEDWNIQTSFADSGMDYSIGTESGAEVTRSFTTVTSD